MSQRKTTTTNDLWEFLKQNCGKVSEGEMLKEWILDTGDVLERRSRFTTWLSDGLTSHHYEMMSEHFPSESVAPFMAKLGAVENGQSVLDPSCGTGLLLSLAADELGAMQLHGIDINAEAIELARLLSPESAEIFLGDSLLDEFPLKDSYDCIVSETPLGLNLKSPYTLPNGNRKTSDFGEALLAWSVEKLSPNGRATFLLSPACLRSRRDKLWRSIESIGAYPRALIHVPSRHLKKTIIAESYIVVVDRTPRDQVFTAQFGTDQALQREILNNFKTHCSGKRPAQGRLVNLNDYRGFPALDAGEQLIKLAPRAGLKPVCMSDLVTDHAMISDSKDKSEDSTNELYLTLNGKCHAALQPEGLQGTVSQTRKVVRLVLDPELADARFVVGSLNDEIGRLFLDSVSLPSSYIQNIPLNQLLEGTFHLPPREIQTKVLEAVSRSTALRAELDEIESTLRSQPSGVDKQFELLRKVNHEDTLEAWLETLPFPLASILWRWRASSGQAREKNEILLHFFEALAEFWATIYLSAAKTDEVFWTAHAADLDSKLENANLAFDRATFGLWKCIVEFFSRKFRMMREEDPERCAAMFGTGRRDALKMLMDRRLLTVLQSANSARNSHAHGGVSANRDINMAHEQLCDLVQTCRSIMGTTWERYELVQPVRCSYSNGLFNYTARRLVGTRTPFVSIERKTISAMEDGFLHLIDRDEERFMKLLPFVRVMPSPRTEENACYFYNQRNHQQQKFVSYHFEADSEIEDFFADTEAAILSLRPRPTLED